MVVRPLQMLARGQETTRDSPHEVVPPNLLAGVSISRPARLAGLRVEWLDVHWHDNPRPPSEAHDMRGPLPPEE